MGSGWWTASTLMPIDFPNSPVINDTFSVGGMTYIFDGTGWRISGSGAVRYDTAQILTEAQQNQARANIAVSGLANHNILINGAMTVSQQFASGTHVFGPNAGRYIADHWWCSVAGSTATISATRNWPMAGSPANGLTYEIVGIVATAQAVLAANDRLIAQQTFTTLRTTHLRWGTANARPVSIGFLVNTNIAGTWSIGLISVSAPYMQYFTTFTTSGAGYEYKTITIPGPTSGDFSSTSISFRLIFCFAAGTGAQSPTQNGWFNSATQYYGVPANNLLSAVNNFFRISGVSLVPGLLPVPQEQIPMFMHDYLDTFHYCQRYYQPIRAVIMAGGYGTAGQIHYNTYFFPEMVSSPTVGLSAFSFTNATSLVISGSSSSYVTLQFTVSAAGAGFASCNVSLDARI